MGYDLWTYSERNPMKRFICRSASLWLALFACGLPQLAPAIPTVTNCTTTVYTNVTDPVMLSFAPDGSLFVGRDNSGSGGSRNSISARR